MAKSLIDWRLKHLDNCKYYIIFDELDEDYRNFDTDEERKFYTSLITSLFKAVELTKTVFSNAQKNIYPLVFCEMIYMIY